MSRFYKKCFIASGGLHVLLALILVVCPAFLASEAQGERCPADYVHPGYSE